MSMNPVGDSIKPPAIGMMIAGIINLIVTMLTIATNLYRLASGGLEAPTSGTEAERVGFYVGFYGVLGIAILSLIVSPLIIVGALRMMNAQNYGLAKTASILTIIPFTSYCCLIGVPIGIWALVTLNKTEVKHYFQGGGGPPMGYPPQQYPPFQGPPYS